MFKEYEFQDLERGNLFYFSFDVDRRLYVKLSGKQYCRLADIRLLLGGMFPDKWYKYFCLDLDIKSDSLVRIVSHGTLLD